MRIGEGGCKCPSRVPDSRSDKDRRGALSAHEHEGGPITSRETTY